MIIPLVENSLGVTFRATWVIVATEVFREAFVNRKFLLQPKFITLSGLKTDSINETELIYCVQACGVSSQGWIQLF